MIKGSTILITGGTGSFGNKFIPMTLEKYSPKKIIIYSRDEMKQWDMASKFVGDSRVSFVIGDVRDKERLTSVMSNVDYVVHAAATKIVPTAEYNPVECIKTNIDGAVNVIEAAVVNSVKGVVALSTDKASNPINLYGATKLASDKLFVAANNSDDRGLTKYSVVRYGNVMGSRGSVIPFFINLKNNNKRLTITDPKMTRFMISLQDGVRLVWKAFDDMVGGEIYVRKIPSMNIMDIARSVDPENDYDIVGIRPGEKMHEQMIGIEDAPHVYEYETYFKILPMIHGWSSDPKRIKDGKPVASDFVYSSDNNKEWMSRSQLATWIEENKDHMGKI